MSNGASLLRKEGISSSIALAIEKLIPTKDDVIFWQYSNERRNSRKEGVDSREGFLYYARAFHWREIGLFYKAFWNNDPFYQILVDDIERKLEEEDDFNIDFADELATAFSGDKLCLSMYIPYLLMLSTGILNLTEVHVGKSGKVKNAPSWLRSEIVLLTKFSRSMFTKIVNNTNDNTIEHRWRRAIFLAQWDSFSHLFREDFMQTNSMSGIARLAEHYKGIIKYGDKHENSNPVIQIPTIDCPDLRTFGSMYNWRPQVF